MKPIKVSILLIIIFLFENSLYSQTNCNCNNLTANLVRPSLSNINGQLIGNQYKYTLNASMNNPLSCSIILTMNSGQADLNGSKNSNMSITIPPNSTNFNINIPFTLSSTYKTVNIKYNINISGNPKPCISFQDLTVIIPFIFNCNVSNNGSNFVVNNLSNRDIIVEFSVPNQYLINQREFTVSANRSKNIPLNISKSNPFISSTFSLTYKIFDLEKTRVFKTQTLNITL